MAEILSIGRVFDGYPCDVASANWSGDTLALSGEVILPTESNRVDIGKAIRERIVSLVGNRDEVDVAVRWTEDSTIDGFYRPLAANADFTAASLNDGVLPWAVELRRAGGGTLPQIETYGLHVIRANPHSITAASVNGSGVLPTTAYPASAFDSWAGVVVLFGATRTASTGSMSLATIGATFNAQVPTTYSVPVADHYDGACEIRATYGSATSQLVSGRWAPPTWDGVVLSNGLIRVSQHASSGNGLFVEVYDGSTWDALNTSGTYWQVESDWAGGTQTWGWGDAGMQILRNGPEQCSIRLFTPDAETQGTWGRVWLDLTVQRGKRHISALIQSDRPSNSASNKFAIEPSTSIAAMAITGAVRATSNDAQGNRAVWGCAGAGAITNNLTTGRLVQTSAGLTQMPFFIGAEVGGSSASGIDAAQHVAWQWYDVAQETQRIVRR